MVQDAEVDEGEVYEDLCYEASNEQGISGTVSAVLMKERS